MGEILNDGKVRAMAWGIVSVIHRESLGISQGELAALLGASQSAVSRGELGQADAPGIWWRDPETQIRLGKLVDRGLERCARLVAVLCPAPPGSAWWWGCYLMAGETGLRGLLEFSIRAEARLVERETVSPKVG